MKKSTIYLVRHAQSHPTTSIHHTDWPLSEIGKNQSVLLAKCLKELEIDLILSSPYLRCIQTIEPYLDNNKNFIIENDFRERLISKEIIDGFYEVWYKSWEDFSYFLPGCESSNEAQDRFVKALTKHEELNRGKTILISTHGNVIGLCLNWINEKYGRNEAENLRNPDVLKLNVDDGIYTWDKEFNLNGIENIATDYNETKVD